MEIFTEIWRHIYHHFFSICAFIPALFGAVLSIPFLTLKNRSRATTLFGLILVFMSLFYTGYFIAVIIYHPYAAYHRWLTLGSSVVCFSLFILFFFYYPDEKNTKTGKIIFISILSAFGLFFTAYIIHSLTRAEIVFNFSSHYYDFTPSLYEKIAPLILLVLLLGILVSGTWRFSVTKDRRWATLSIALLAFFTFLVPVVFNILSRSGYVSRGTYQISQDLSTLFGFFSITIIYINTTKDRTSLLTRVIIVSFATFLLMFQEVGYFILNNQESTYNALKYRDSIIFLSQGIIPEGLQYHAVKKTDGTVSFIGFENTRKEDSAFFFTGHTNGLDDTPLFKTGPAGNNVITYYFKDTGGTEHEFAYSYLNYRAFLHPPAKVLIIILAVITLVIIFGYRLFFYSSITVPLTNIQRGIESVRRGNKNVQLPVLIEDEIGMITDSFNIMVARIEEADISLADYTQNLGRMVEDRTEKLTRSLDDLKRTQNKLIESEKFAFLGSLVAGVAHEINTPLGICITASSFLLTETSRILKHFTENRMTKNDLEKYLQDAADSSAILLSNLYNANDMVGTFKKVAVDQSHEEIRTFNVSEYIHDILNSLRHTLKKSGHQIELACPDNLEIKSYPGALYQILTNLVMNSVIHGFETISAGTISIKVSVEDASLVIDYNDNGSGMNSEQLHRMYEPFYTTKRGKGGSGLGMNIVYNIITQKLKGTITAESETGKGTRFKILLPKNLS